MAGNRQSFKPVVLFAAAAAVCVVGYLFLLSVFARGATRATPAVVPALCLAAAMLALNARFLRADGLTLAALGLDAPRVRVPQFGLGFLGGSLLVLVWAAALALVTGARWGAHAGFDAGAAAGLAAFTLFNNAAEELTYRGYALIHLEEAYGPIAAVLAPSLLFALAHVQGGVPWPSALAGVLTSGILYAVLFRRTRSMPLVLGVHVATNVMQELLGLRVGPASAVAPVYPAPVSGGRGMMFLALLAAVNLALALLIARGIRREASRGS